MKKWLLLILSNVLALLVLFYFLDYFGYVKSYSNLRDRIVSSDPNDYIPTEEERRMEAELAAEEDRKKLEAFLQEKETALVALEQELQTEREKITEERMALSKERENLLMREERLQEEANAMNEYAVKVDGLAVRFYDMPPQLAAERVLALNDDLLIIDVLAAMDREAARRGQQSIVPFLFSLMPPEEAARILKKSTVSL